MHGKLVIGVDCGGTRTRAAVASLEGRLLGVGDAGGGNPRDGGLARLCAAVDGAVGAAFGDGALARGPVAAVTVGVAGVGNAREGAAAREALGALGLVAGGGAVEVVHDMRVAQAGAFAGGPGMVLIAGTGSCCYGRAEGGREWRAGGWGGRLDDGGSATGLGLAAVRAVIRACDGRGTATVLQERVLEALGVGDLRAVLGVVESGGYREPVSRLGPLVTAAAAEGDAVAMGIVEEGAAALADMAAAVVDGLGLRGAETPPGLACLGGVFGAGEVVLGPLRRRLGRVCEIRAGRLPGVMGAVLLAAGRVAGAGADVASCLEASWRAKQTENL